MIRMPNFEGSFHPFNTDDCRYIRHVSNTAKKLRVKYFFENYIHAERIVEIGDWHLGVFRRT